MAYLFSFWWNLNEKFERTLGYGVSKGTYPWITPIQDKGVTTDVIISNHKSAL